MLLQLLASALRVSSPLLFAAFGGLVSERSGVINIALEGMMLAGAFGAAVATWHLHSPWLGLLGGLATGLILAAIYAFAVIQLRANQIVAGTAINLLALGLTPSLCKVFYDVTSSTPAIPIQDRFQSAPLFLAWSLVPVCWLWLNRTRSGLWVAFAGEHPEALETAGVRVSRIRWFAVLTSGALAGLGGATLSIFLSSAFSRGMTGGRGFMALAALIFGKWKPIPTALACLLFGFAEALQMRLQGVGFWGGRPIPVQFIQILPYVITVLVLAGFVGYARPPKALGKSWRRG